MMRTYVSIVVFFVCCLVRPLSADLADIQPVTQYVLPADIMQVDFAHETWVYRLYEDGTVKKVVSPRIVASLSEKKTEKKTTKAAGSQVSSTYANPCLGAS